MEIWIALDVVLIFLATFICYLLLREGRPVPALSLAALGIALAYLDIRRVQRMRLHRKLAAVGNIGQGRVIDQRPRHWTFAPRADGRSRFLGRPLLPALQITYEFRDDADRRHTGSFVVSSKDSRFYEPQRMLEIFYLPEEPSLNGSSLVIRWYYRLGGAATPPKATPSEEFEVIWQESPDDADKEARQDPEPSGGQA
jgi:hypothetical protein